MHDSVIIIPSRMAATRLPNKPLMDICGVSMIKRVINQAMEANIAPVYVATPDIEIFDHIKDSAATGIMTSYDHQSGTDRIYEALNKINHNEDIKYIINLQGDLPNIDPKFISRLYNRTKANQSGITTLAAEINDKAIINNPNCVKIALCEKSNQALYFSRSPIPYNADVYYNHIGIYGYKREALNKFVTSPPSGLELKERLEQLRALQNNIKISVEIMDKIPISIDTEEDMRQVINFIKNR